LEGPDASSRGAPRARGVRTLRDVVYLDERWERWVHRGRARHAGEGGDGLGTRRAMRG
jgi:hypothetical protein